MDSAEPVRVRLKAAEMIGDIGELESIEPIRNLKFGNQRLQEQVDAAVQENPQAVLHPRMPLLRGNYQKTGQGLQTLW
jgi:hypothetical protein